MSYGAHVIEMNEIFIPRKNRRAVSGAPLKRGTRLFLVMMAATLALAILAPITVLAA